MTKRTQFRENIGRMLLLMPALIIIGATVFIPFLTGIPVALTNWDGISKTMDYTGLKNFHILLKSVDFKNVLKYSLVFAVSITALNNLFSLSLAVGLNKAFRGRGIVRTLFFIPTCLSAVLAAFIWNYIYYDVFKELFGIKSLLGNPDTAMLGIIFIALWNSLGINIVIYLAGLSSVPADLYEAAIVDGANGWQRFVKVTLPMIMPSFTVCITMTLTSSLKEFATTMAATGGGPGKTTQTVSIYIYNNMYSYNQAGYGQAVALLFLIALFAISAVFTYLFRRKVGEL